MAGADSSTSGDVVKLILADHRELERLMRALRSIEEDRAAVLAQLADLLVAHAEAEEHEVYPALRREAPDEAEEIEHGAEEHAEGHEKLLALLEVGDVDSEAFDGALEELVTAINHHLDEEERTILNAAREEVDAGERERLGAAFRKARASELEGRPGSPGRVRELVQAARAEGKLD